MSHIAFQPRGPEVVLDVDYVVVGSGAGGATAALALARGGARVAVVEAGPWRDPHDYPSSVYGAMRDMLDVWGSTFTRGRAYWPIVQGKLVGGSTVVNSAIHVRTPGDVLRRWRDDHGFAGEDELQRIQDELEHELSPELVPRGSLGRSNELALQGAQRVGYDNHVMSRYVKACRGDGRCLPGCKAGKKQSLNELFMPRVLTHGGEVLSCAPVDRVLFEGSRAIGVRGRFTHPQTRQRGAAFVVRARRGVLMAASVVYSAPLLMRSGVRLPALGEGFRSHPGGPIIGVYDEPVDMGRGATQGWASSAFRESPGFKLETLSLPLDMLSGRIAGAGEPLMERLRDFRHFAVWVQATRAESTGRIRPDLFGRSAVHYTLDRADMKRFVAGLHMVARTHFAAGARAVLPGIFGLPASLGPDQVDLLADAPLDPRAYVAILSHLFGGCDMGRDRATSVVDRFGAVHDYTGLYVVDASVIPTNLGVNPQHTIMALAQYFAEHMLEARASFA